VFKSVADETRTMAEAQQNDLGALKKWQPSQLEQDVF
jgi:hypothetical protein